MTMESFDVAETVTGADVIQDLCERVAQSLSSDCRLRSTDSYQGYGARVVAEIWLSDVDPQTVQQTISVGDCGPGTPSSQVVVDVPLLSPAEVHGTDSSFANLERTASGDEPEQPPRRLYTPRHSVPRVAK
ncbi:MAG TPA: hypothetical protein VMU48_15335 [Terracidiphilus sp.]|nr:hypothetical protein [Terracidiphilus sp.]